MKHTYIAEIDEMDNNEKTSVQKWFNLRNWEKYYIVLN